MDLSVVPYKGDIGKNGGERSEVGVGEKNGRPGVVVAAAGARYWECMKNHAAGLGAQAFDGCGEFMPGGEPGTLEALKCAACGCHRNFHRKEDCGGTCGDYVPYDHAQPHHHPLLLYNAADNPSSKFPSFFRHPLPPPMLPLPGHAYRHVAFPAPSAVAPVDGNRGSETPPPPPHHPPSALVPDLTSAKERDRSRKRFRTKFTQEQKEEMQKFAEKVGWRIQRHDNDELQEFCTKVGVKRHVLKVWMHNNKSALSGGAAGRTAGPSNSDPAAPAPAIRV